MVQTFCPGEGEHVWGSPDVKSRILGPFIIVIQLLLGFLIWNFETVTGNSPMDEDWRNTLGVFMCAEICDDTGAGMCDGAHRLALVVFVVVAIAVVVVATATVAFSLFEKHKRICRL